ncbi:hypothetical protein R3W88_031778 [Solanum pinnatisectum]|uniref:Uncharacterized protein n=1 Tax=Solanum pinnatisectum TaxID=50273 RepID=A0AAV9LMA9_9SOLN|nr:hypothetical protein R3W88_031778 [Solanum pinnatisectum]
MIRFKGEPVPSGCHGSFLFKSYLLLMLSLVSLLKLRINLYQSIIKEVYFDQKTKEEKEMTQNPPRTQQNCICNYNSSMKTQLLIDVRLEIYMLFIICLLYNNCIVRVPWKIKALNFCAGARDDKGSPIIRDYYSSPLTASGNTHDDMLLAKLETIGFVTLFIFNMDQGLLVWSEWLVFNRVNARARKGLVLGHMPSMQNAD